MNKLFFIFVLSFYLGIQQMNAQYENISAFKYIYYDNRRNTKEIIVNQVKKHFESIGFRWLSSKEYAQLSTDEFKYILYPDIYHQKGILQFGLVSRGGFCIEYLLYGGVNSCLKKLFNCIDYLNYKFDPYLINTIETENINFSYVDESVVKNYLDTSNCSPIEGIYKSLNNVYGTFKYAIIKNNDKYYAIIISDTNMFLWRKGNLKLALSYIKPDLFDVDYYHSHGIHHCKENGFALFDGTTLTVVVNNKSKESFYKLYPNREQNNKNETTPQVPDMENIKSTGSGVIISNNIIATNYHVVSDAQQVKIEMDSNGGRKQYNCNVLVSDKTNDLSLLVVDDDSFNKKMPPYSISPKSVDVGTSIFTMGYPLTQYLGNEIKVTDGIISSKTGYQGDVTTYQISAAIQPGNSGGALFDMSGNLIGITNAGIREGENIGYAIKSTYLLNLIDSAPFKIDIPNIDNQDKLELSALVKNFKSFVVKVLVY